MTESLREALSTRVPSTAVDYCCELWQQYPFSFQLTRNRISKLGDYRFDPRNGSHTVTVNNGLNSYQFLITYVHEVAHRVAHKHRSRQKPHGPEWKKTFRDLMLPLLNSAVFPDDILRILAGHMRNPKASTAGDPQLVKVLATYDEGNETAFTLGDIPSGNEFTFRKRAFRKLETKRTRAVCLDLKNGKKYLIPEMAEVNPVGGIEKPVTLLLSDIEEGEVFRFKKKTFKKIEKKRSRSLCLDLESRSLYSIPESAEVAPAKQANS